MSQTISLSKPVFEELIHRIRRLESVVFGGEKKQFPDEYVKLSPRAKKRYQRMEEDFKKGKNFYVAENVNKLIEELNS